MEYAEHLKFYKRLQEQGKPSPLDDIPSLSEVSSWYLDVFRILHSGRQELNPIPFQDIISYFEHFDIIGSKEEFVEIIQSLDSTFLDHHNKVREQKHGRHNHSSSKARR